MRNNEEFDRIARQKMNERSFAFDELQWQKAQKMIASKRSNNRYFHLLWLLIPALAVYVWIANGDQNDNLVTAHPPQIASDAQVPSFTSNEVKTNSNSISNHNEKHVSQQNDQFTTSGSNNETDETVQSQERRNTQQETSEREPLQHKEDTNVLIQKTKTSDSKKIYTTASATTTNTPTLLQSEENITVHSMDGTSKELNQPSNITSSLITSQSAQNSSNPYHEHNKKAEEAQVNESTLAIQHESAEYIKSFGGQFDESEYALMHTRTIPVNLIKLWKISLLAGLWNNTTNITGLKPEAWMETTTGQRSFGYGAEIIRNYHHFGWGTGLHYSNYQETILADPKKEIVSETYRYWYLNPVDTTIWIITDSVNNGNGYTYIGYSDERTIQVITAANATRSDTTLIREAKKIQNSVSYFEVPLLADIHTGKGKWLFGLRGGPTWGQLIVRNGTLPNAEGNGYEALNNAMMKRWIPGYTLRAYVDYKLNANWSVGLQAGKRGLFGNTLKGDAINRKTNAMGGIFSLSYLIRSKDHSTQMNR